ncbi:deoxyribonuclease-1 [Methylohalomonas lacus]|uniref:Deoxyribonuclease-1 n=1 Tax=Methylohalomonas lacus TaxID=398773 RepID=A0AAE3HJU7_9GAMM|nr:endonuclease [Methylohalomonas lacus]MCS3903080.1 deoxyribonuclease-1 [Methylohalomonas lacus]
MSRLLLLLFPLLIAPVIAQDELTDFDTARGHFWETLYPGGGWTLYCGLRFEAEGNGDGVMATIDHIYSMPRVYRALGCSSRLRCNQERGNEYRRIEADLHNMYPATGAVVIQRADSYFAGIESAESRFQECDFRRRGRRVEPRDIAKGNIARTLLYMQREYGLPLAEDMELLKSWNRVDPPSEQEMNRNDRIERLQGNRNPFIDQPQLADDL